MRRRAPGSPVAYHPDMLTEDFDYVLPPELIAQRPTTERTGSRLLYLAGGGIEHRRFPDLVRLLRPGDLLVVNDTRVVPARLVARKDSGGRAEILFERLIDAHRMLAQVRVSKPLRVGRLLHLDDGVDITVLGRRQTFYELATAEPVLALLERYGHVPLPPYIGRGDDHLDRDRYQTVFAARAGAAAAPTAGLHFDAALLEGLRRRGVALASITLHVGAGTFQPVRSEHVEDHRMHSEWCAVPAATADAVRACRGRVVAVGTTVLRTLESVAASGGVRPFCGETDLFIYPGFEFRAVDVLLTNFHLPRSTLLMLTCAFGGTERVLSAYRSAVDARYRFFSYGDAMLVERHQP